MKNEKQKDFNEVPLELTPVWWKKQHSIPSDSIIIIPDTSYDNPIAGINYESSDGGDGIDYNTGVIVAAPLNHESIIGRWCHYKKHGFYIFHTFRERFSNGEQNEMEKKPALKVNLKDVVLITEKQIF